MSAEYKLIDDRTIKARQSDPHVQGVIVSVGSNYILTCDIKIKEDEDDGRKKSSSSSVLSSR